MLSIESDVVWQRCAFGHGEFLAANYTLGQAPAVAGIFVAKTNSKAI
jgi:hypothetical protein